LQDSKPTRPKGWPWRRRPRSQRTGATPEFAQAITRAEFGKYYPKDLPRKREKTAVRPKAPRPPCQCSRKPDGKAHVPWRPPSVRERRTELAQGKARLLKGRNPPRPDTGKDRP
jgi:hypothetical protein